MRNLRIFTGSSHPELTARISDRLGLQISPAISKKFPNREMFLELGVSVRNKDVFLVQSGSPHINDHLMELLIMINACKSASAKRITAVIPYFPYTKQSKKKGRVAITAKLVANMLAVAGVDHLITMDLHSSQMQGFFNKPIDNLYAEPSIAKYIIMNVPDHKSGVVVSKNAGGAKRVTSLADRLKIDFALIHRERHHGKRPQLSSASLLEGGKSLFDSVVVGSGQPHNAKFPSESEDENDLTSGRYIESTDEEDELARNRITTEDPPPFGNLRLTLIGDVQGKTCFLLDDIIDDPHSYMDAARHLKNFGASKIYLVATHGILSGDALSQLSRCEEIYQVVVTNSYPIPEHKINQSRNKLRIIDISGVLSEAIRRTHNGESISYLFHTAI